MKIRNSVTSKKSAPILLLMSLIATMTFLIHWLGFNNQSIKSGLDLSKNWKICHTTSPSGTEEKCEDLFIDLPDNQHIRPNESIEYRNSFITPNFCLNQNNDCIFYIGGVYQGVELFLNNHTLGKHFARADLYPAFFKIPRDFLKTNGTPNAVRLSVYTEEKHLKPSITKSPIGIINTSDFHSITFGFFGERFILPIINASICFTLTLISLFWLLSKNSANKNIKNYIFYNIAAFLYMLYATRIPRELFYSYSGKSLNFVFRYLMDFSFTLLIISYFNLKSFSIKFIKVIYALAILMFLVFFTLSFYPTTTKFLAVLQVTPLLSLSGLRQNDYVYSFACIFSPLMVLGSLIGFQETLKKYSTTAGEPILFFVFLVLIPMQIADILAFISLIHLDHEIYYMRLYPSYISLAFGYAIWMKWIEKEVFTEATLSAGEIAKGVAHDLRSPITALKVLSKKTKNLTQDEQTLLTAVVNSIDKTASHLLSQYRASTNSNASSPENSIFVKQRLNVVINSILKRKQYVLESFPDSKLNFIFTTDNSSDILCNLSLVEFERALDNIINNAIDSVSTLAEPVVLISVRTKNRTAYIEIEDNGKGFDNALLKDLNNHEFNRSSKATGHGIGLNAALRTIQKHQGTLTFSNNTPQGAIVTIALPLCN